MKKRTMAIALTLSVLMILSLVIPTLSASAQTEESGRLLGDVDNDGRVTVADATVIQMYLAELETLDDEAIAAGDIDSSGVLEVTDATWIQRWLADYDDGYAISKPIENTGESTQESSEPSSTESTQPSTEASTGDVTGDEWKENTGTIVLSDSGITVTGEGAYVDGNVVILTEGGDWLVTGSCSDGMIYVNTGEDKDVNDKVKLRLSGMSLKNTTGPAIYFDRCKKAFITLESGTENVLEDAASYAKAKDYTAAGTTYSIDCSAAKGTIHSDDTLEIKGKGSINVTGHCKHGICSDDDILIENGVFEITSTKDGLHANDDITMNGKNIEVTINAGSDGVESEGTLNMTLVKTMKITGAGKGLKAETDLVVTAGSYTIDTTDDCINGNAAVTLSGGNYDLTSGDEAVTAASTLTAENVTLTAKTTGKGIKAATDLIVNSGTFTIDSGDDSVHCNANITIKDGEFTLTSGDDGVHADTTLTIEGGAITVTKSYEGLEGNDVVINGGTISLTASDDGINAAGGQDQSSQGNRPGQNPFQPGSASNNAITINDGYVFVVASGDGIDSNGALNFNGGTVIVQGPSTGGNFSVDADGTIGFNGGTVMAICSSSAMWEDVNGKAGNAVLNKSIGTVSKDGTIAVTDASGNLLSIVKSKLSGSVGILYYTDRTASLTSAKAVVGGAFTGSFDSFGYSESGTLDGGTSATLSAGSSGGGPGGGPGGRP